MLESLFNKLVGLKRPATFLKIDYKTGVFLCKCEVFKNTYFEEHLRTTVSIIPGSCLLKDESPAN